MGLPDLTPNALTLFALYANRTSADMAMSALIVAQSGVGPALRTNYVEFVRGFDDEVVVQTNNSSELSAFKRLPNEFTTKFWKIRDIHQLYQLHRLLADRFRQRGRPVLRLYTQFGGDAMRYVSEAVLQETFRNQVAPAISRKPTLVLRHSQRCPADDLAGIVARQNDSTIPRTSSR